MHHQALLAGGEIITGFNLGGTQEKAVLASVAITTLAVVAGTASIAAASPAAKPATVTSRTLSLDVHFSPSRHFTSTPIPTRRPGSGLATR